MRRTQHLALILPLAAAFFPLTVWADGPAVPHAKDTAATSITPPEYTIGAGDVLQINVWKEPEASVAATVVRSDGKISIPLLKDVDVVGMTTGEVEKVLTEKFTGLIPGADVTVLVKEAKSKKVYLLGAVKKEGPIALLAPTTALQAIVEAGGFTDFAKVKKIYVIRTENGKQTRIPFDYQAVIKGTRPESDIPLLANDIIFVPR